MKPVVTIKAEAMQDDTGQPITVAPHPEQIVTMSVSEPICEGAMLRKRKMHRP